MALKLNQQIIENISRAKHILITTKPCRANLPLLSALDGLGSGLGFLLFLEALRKPADLVVAGFQKLPQLSFLPKLDAVKPALENLQKFIIKLNVEKTGLHEMKYDLNDHELQIFLTPQHGFLKPGDIKAHAENFKYDLIIALDTVDLESLGEVFEKHPDLFFRTPIINIDHTGENEHFGSINAVDLTASATAEILYDLLENWDRRLIDEKIATSLLTGILTETRSFQKAKTPKSFETASQLINMGADREAIIQSLFHNRSINTLKLWGAVLANLKHDLEVKLAWSSVTWRDFLETGGCEDELMAAAEELVLSSKETDHILILYEKPLGGVGGIFTSLKLKRLTSLDLPCSIERNADFWRFSLTNKNLLEAEREIIDVLKKRLYNIYKS